MEKFKYYKTPTQLDAKKYKVCHLEVIKEKVRFTSMLKNEGKTYNEVLVMKDYGIDSSWKYASIAFFYYTMLI